MDSYDKPLLPASVPETTRQWRWWTSAFLLVLSCSSCLLLGFIAFAPSEAPLAAAPLPSALDLEALSGLGKFLRDQRKHLSAWSHAKLPSSQSVTVVVGNEASDADSIIAALTYAYLKASLQTMEPAKHQRLFLPVVKCKRKHMRLRQETLEILKYAGVRRHDLIHMDDKDFGPLMRLIDAEDPRFNFVLVDHNKADGLLEGKIDGRVSEILDHHKDLEAHDGKREVIAFDDKHGVPIVQSACTIIAQEFLASKIGRELLKEDDGAVASALLSVIVIDSKEFKGQDSDDADMRVAERLKADIPNVDSSEHLQFKWLMNKRTNHSFWSSATLEENFLYDFKQFDSAGFTCGISSTFLSLEDLERKLKDPDQVSAFEEYVQDPTDPDPDAEVQSTIFVIMLKRDPMHLAVLTKTPGLQGFTRKFLVSSNAEILDLKSAKALHKSGYGIFSYLQGNSKASRKQVGPTCQALLRAFAKA